MHFCFAFKKMFFILQFVLHVLFAFMLSHCFFVVRDLFFESFVATLRVARLTLQTRKLWLVGVVTGRNATCPEK